jgi:hypothetical protein
MPKLYKHLSGKLQAQGKQFRMWEASGSWYLQWQTAGGTLITVETLPGGWVVRRTAKMV